MKKFVEKAVRYFTAYRHELELWKNSEQLYKYDFGKPLMTFYVTCSDENTRGLNFDRTDHKVLTLDDDDLRHLLGKYKDIVLETNKVSRKLEENKDLKLLKDIDKCLRT
jgi:hypothetical protein